MSVTTYTNGKMGYASIPDAIIRLCQVSEVEMNELKSLVEATIDSVHVDNVDKALMLDLSSPWEGGSHQQIIATGVDDFVVNEMRLSNIIDCAKIHAFDGDAFRQTELAQRLFFLMRGKEAEGSDLEWDVLIKKIERVKRGELTLMEIVPIYGATVLILAAKIELVALPRAA
jgi:hypothetical protein